MLLEALECNWSAEIVYQKVKPIYQYATYNGYNWDEGLILTQSIK